MAGWGGRLPILRGYRWPSAIPTRSLDAWRTRAPATLIRDGHPGRDAPQGQPVRAMTLAEVALHNRADDCYMAIKGKVYNVTPYLEYHPGGPIELMRGAGVLFPEYCIHINTLTPLRETCFLIQTCVLSITIIVTFCRP